MTTAEQHAQAVMARFHTVADEVVVAALLALATTARNQCPEADYIRLEPSDQGEWMAPNYVLTNAQGTEVSDDWDDEGYASWLDLTRTHAWCLEPWCVDIELGHRTLTCTVDIQAVMDGITIPEEPA